MTAPPASDCDPTWTIPATARVRAALRDHDLTDDSAGQGQLTVEQVTTMTTITPRQEYL